MPALRYIISARTMRLALGLVVLLGVALAPAFFFSAFKVWDPILFPEKPGACPSRRYVSVN